MLLHVVLSLVVYAHTISGIKIETLKHCCSLGSNYANSGLKCTSFQTPIAGVSQQDELSCLNSVDVCCKNQQRTLACNLGAEDATAGRKCETSSSEDSGDFRKDCCEACTMGIEAGRTGQSCSMDGLGLLPPYDSTFTQCCQNVLSTSSTSTTSPATVTASQATTMVEGNSSDVPLDSPCDISEICAHYCVPTSDSYRCECYKGYTLMADGISCRPNKNAGSQKDRCETHNPCDQICLDTGLAIKCSCNDGYSLGKDKRTCKDIDECALNLHECSWNETCVNGDGFYYCDDPANASSEDDVLSKCPVGYTFNGDKQVCDDIDECVVGLVCDKPKVCVNTIGSFICEGDDTPPCPPGFFFKPATAACEDIDECLTGTDDCNHESQICLNTKGNFTCLDKVSKKSCPPGFKKNIYTQNCEDINECEENDDACRPDEECVNEAGGHNCLVRPKIHPLLTPQHSTTTVRPTEATTPTRPLFASGPPSVHCPNGYEYSSTSGRCQDINECTNAYNPCRANELCYNTPGSYICNCKEGFAKDSQTGDCKDVNECQMGLHNCMDGQRCDNTIGSYHCSRVAGCGTGYTLNSATGLCEDDDECLLGTDNCRSLGNRFQCRNTLGSYRCERVRCVDCGSSTLPTKPVVSHDYPVVGSVQKRCLPGYFMNSVGHCQDIDECASNPCNSGEICKNLQGRYQCIGQIQCTRGYELNEAGDACIDVNECTRGIHKCTAKQVCKNGPGYYTCQCPPGHRLDNSGYDCTDIDECKLSHGRVCSVYADCTNTIGSYQCTCKEGYRTKADGCDDINECLETPGLCQHNCVNVWGSYRCACKSGFTLNHDNRTCSDIDECEKFKESNLCIGTCINIPGSYTCQCPQGYRLGLDGRSCQDIDECSQNVCRPEDICVNSRGGFKCHTIHCPPNYLRDPEHRSRCKRVSNVCDSRDMQCLQMPQQYSYHFITLVSDLPITQRQIPFFHMKGPSWTIARADFAMTVTNVICPHGVEKADESFFRVDNYPNAIQLSLVKSIRGPQEITIKVEMKLYVNQVFNGVLVAHIIVTVSEYPF